MAYAVAFDDTDFGEVDVYSLDFTPRLTGGDAISTTTVALSVETGVDATPASRLYGAPVVSGAIVSQALTGLLTDVTYYLTATVTTTQGRVLSDYATISCRKPYLEP